MGNFHQVTCAIYKSVMMVLMADAIPVTKKADWTVFSSFKSTVQKLLPFPINAECIYDYWVPQLIVVRS